MNEDLLQFITFIHQHYAMTGELLTEQKAADDFGFTKTYFRQCMADERVQEALEERGIDLKRFHLSPDSWKSKALTPKQLLVANSILDLTDTRSEKKKLQDLEVSTGTYQSWLKDPVFSNYLRTRAESMLGDHQHDAHLALIDEAKSGNIRAIQYLNEINGRFLSQAGKNGNAESAVINLQNMIVRIVEIVQDEVDDPQTQLRISEKLAALTQGNILANGTAPEPIIVPPTAPARQYTDKQKELLDHGDGINL